MRNTAIAALCLVTFTGAFLFMKNRQPAVDAMLRRAFEGVVTVSVETENGRGHGSGVMVGCRPFVDGKFIVTLLTAKHVADTPEEERHLTVLNQPARLLASHPLLDVSLIEVVLDYKPMLIELASSSPLVGSTIYSIGFGGCGEEWITQGVLSAQDRGGSLCPGDSGGAVINTSGQLIGVMIQYDTVGFGTPVFHHGTFVPVAKMRGWVRSQMVSR